ncbi:CAAX amino terminal protease self- immunity [Clostridium homopropionicum DSM 5847]|uniref:CAAX amino terminal protease self-immunity n=1 Tax=Clostridium homopropionicum DSM 5847 TaxID=1121318 RepID=A0A0L6Z795_9CLOT|nr:type II CAAX endopeptidase family protein [Clostridium homopropionicum]KOA18841.1 CAAX amino terminal protease self- immunity [Clostridium homopropionicum DSM 5847]SFG90008.1 CAAX protease self-immunity [Clostridium homopropionicum]
MNSISKEVQIVKLIYMVTWIFMVLAIIALGKSNYKVKNFKDKMIVNWKQSLSIVVLCYMSIFIGTWNASYLTNILGPITLFCQCLIGLTIAKSIDGYEPLPVTRAIIENKQAWRKIILMFGFGLLVVFLTVFIGAFSQSICSNIFNEVNNSSEAVNMLPDNKWMLFFTLLSGAGIVEETIYRLIFLSLILKITNRPWLSIVLSSLLFGLYHLTPINTMYSIYWQYPITQFVSTSLAGMIFGYFYVKRGYETAVIGHTLADWLPVLIFMK